MASLHISLWVVILLVALALAFDFMNGFHDAANSIATVVSTGVLKPHQAVAFAGFFNVVAISIFQLKVASTIGKGTIDPAIVDHIVVFGALVGAIAWNIITWYYGIPSSSSHALIGGLVGAALIKSGPGALISAGVLKTVAFIFISHLLGFLLGTLMMVAVSWIFFRTPPRKVDKWFRRLQLFSASLYSLGHGGNDAQKTMGIITLALFAGGILPTVDVPWWTGSLAEGAALFLEGKNRDLVKVLKKSMAESAARENFEEAARFRDLIRSIEITVEKQKMVAQGGDMDVLGFYREHSRMEILLLFVRGGSLIGSRNFSFSWEMDEEEAISSFLNEYYHRDVYIPEEVLLPVPIEEPGALAELLSEKGGKRVALTFPRRGTKFEMVKLANRNAETAAMEIIKSRESSESILEELRQRLHLTKTPRRIECYDISNFQGQLAVASGVAFLEAKADKSNYRRYRIKTVTGSDDYGMMYEVLSRRFGRESGPEELPDLIIVDGGQGQLNVLTSVMRELGITGIDAASLAKSRVEEGMTSREITRSNERVFLPGRKNPVILRQNSPPLLLLARIRDEAHRFAITYHKKLRGKNNLRSSLADIAGVGEKRRKELLRHFGSLKKIKDASIDELRGVQGMDSRTAEAVWVHFHKETSSWAQHKKGDA